jgi:tetraacyldisaccharide 4'-kinase
VTRPRAMEIVDSRRLRPVDEMGPIQRACLAPAAFPASLLYGAIAGLWRRLPAGAHDLGRPVVSIGSVLAGGSGKTPLCMRLAGTLAERGRRVCIISRGYMRKSRRSPLVVSDGGRVLASVEEAGDEPFLMATRLPGVGVVVGKDRVEAAAAARSAFDPDLFILDDGFQTRGVVKTLDIVCLDGASLRSTQRFLPWGRLREGLGAIEARHVVVVLMEEGAPPPVGGRPPGLAAEAVFFAVRTGPVFLGPDGGALGRAELLRDPVLVLSGIARPAGFEATCRAAGLDAPVSLRTDDHHWYNQRDAARVLELMEQHRCKRVVTTEKDLVRLPRELKPLAVVLRTDVTLADSPAFWDVIERGLR